MHILLTMLRIVSCQRYEIPADIKEGITNIKVQLLYATSGAEFICRGVTASESRSQFSYDMCLPSLDEVKGRNSKHVLQLTQ
jgi:hypothetical protein